MKPFGLLGPSVTAAFVVDDSGFIAGWNEGAERILGHAAADVVGCSTHEVICGRDPSGRTVCHPSCALYSEKGCADMGNELVLFPYAANRRRFRITTSVFRVAGTAPSTSFSVHVITSAKRVPRQSAGVAPSRLRRPTDSVE